MAIFWWFLTILAHIRQHLGNKCCLNVDQMLTFKFFKKCRYYFICVLFSYRENSPRTLQYSLDTMQESVNTDFLGKGWILSKKVEKMVATFFSDRVKKNSFCDITIIFWLRHVFIHIVWRKKRIMIIEQFPRIIFGKNDPPQKIHVFFGGSTFISVL